MKKRATSTSQPPSRGYKRAVRLRPFEEHIYDDPEEFGGTLAKKHIEILKRELRNSHDHGNGQSKP